MLDSPVVVLELRLISDISAPHVLSACAICTCTAHCEASCACVVLVLSESIIKVILWSLHVCVEVRCIPFKYLPVPLDVAYSELSQVQCILYIVHVSSVHVHVRYIHLYILHAWMVNTNPHNFFFLLLVWYSWIVVSIFWRRFCTATSSWTHPEPMCCCFFVVCGTNGVHSQSNSSAREFREP